MVVSFSSAHAAKTFFNESAQSWSACANRQVTVTMPGGTPTTIAVGAVSRTNDTLSAMETLDNENVQHVLTVVNNVVIDTLAGRGTAADIARQIAAKVPTQ